MTYVHNTTSSESSTAGHQQAPAPHSKPHVPRWIRWMFAGLIFGACVSGGIIFGGWTYLGNWLTQHGI